jgi:hypothetical protein
MYKLLSGLLKIVLPSNKFEVGLGVVVQTSTEANDVAVGVNDAPGLTHAFPCQI